MKKGQSIAFALILVLASAVVIGAVVNKFVGFGMNKADIEACRSSIILAAKTKILPSQSLKSSLSCPRDKLGDVLIKKNDIVVNDKIDQKKASKIVADAMAECWYITGEGKIDPFSYWSDDSYTGKSICMHCKQIKFEDDLIEWMNLKQTELAKKELGININEFTLRPEDIEKEIKSKLDKILPEKQNSFKEKYKDYVIMAPVNFLLNEIKPKSKISYWNYLYGNTPADSLSLEEDKLVNSYILPGSIIYVRAYRTKSKDYFWRWMSFGGLALAIVAIATGGIALIAFGIWALSAGAIVGGAVVMKLVAIAAVVGLGAYNFVPAFNSFAECPDCNLVGGVSVINPVVYPLESKTQVCFKAPCDIKENIQDIAICDVLIN